MTTLDDSIAAVVARDSCSGCGACLLLDTGLSLELDARGFARPVRVAPSTASDDAAARFAAACPGKSVTAQNPPGSTRHPTMGSVTSAWEAWSNDPELRFGGSSGGVLSALTTWLVETGRAPRVTAAAPDPAEARRTVSVSIVSREQALAAASSRYAPVTGPMPELVPDGAIVGPPCRVSAVRALDDAPLLLSYFCAGTPSQHATDALSEKLIGSEESIALRYRGNGWPGRFTVERLDGSVATLSYDESWGEHLGRAVQWRCKLCPDGVGESADIVAADLWEADDKGYPVFAERDGVSALIARTARGHALVLEAIDSGVLSATPLDIGRLASVQPLQVDRRSTLFGRMLGSRLAGRSVPRYRGFGLLRLSLPRWRDTVRVARGAFRRARSRGAHA